MTITDDQLERLKKLIDEILAGNKFYQRKLMEAGITGSSSLRSIADLERLPLTTREELTEDQTSSPPFGTNLTYSPERYVHWHRTSGAHGRPLHWLDTNESWDWLKACWATVFEAAEVSSKDRIFFAFSFGPFLGFWIAWAAAEGLGALRFSGANQSSLERLRNIVNFQITVVCSTPTYALHLAEVAEKEGIELRNSAVNKLIVAGEPGGSIRETRELIEKSWGAIVFDHAGATEVGPHSFACSEARSLHLNEGEFIAEVFDESGAKSKTGELVLTNLGRSGSPVIRYRTGDLVHVDTHPCPCARTFISFNQEIARRIDGLKVRWA